MLECKATNLDQSITSVNSSRVWPVLYVIMQPPIIHPKGRFVTTGVHMDYLELLQRGRGHGHSYIFMLIAKYN